MQCLNLSGDDAAFPSPVAFLDATTQTIWWDLRWIYRRLRAPLQRKKDWNKWFQTCVARNGSVLDMDNHYRISGAGTYADELTNVCTTLALYSFLFSIRLYGRTPRLKTAALDYLRHAVLRACETISVADPMEVELHGLAVRISRNGSIYGFADVICTAPNALTVDALVVAWDRMHHANVVDCGFFSDFHPLVNVVQFLLDFAHLRRSRKQCPLGRRFEDWFNVIGQRIISWLAARIPMFILEIHSASYDLSRPPPSLPGAGLGRKYTRVEPEAAWEALHRANAAGVSAQVVARVRQRDDDMGAHDSLAPCWEYIHQLAYDERAKLAFTGASHVCLSIDGSTHSYHETLLGIAYTWENNQAAYTKIQHMLPGRDVLKGEAALTDLVQLLAEQRRLERVAAYRQLQAIGHMTSMLCRRCLEDYDMPPGVHLTPLAAREARVVLRGGETDTAVVVNRDTNTYTEVLPGNVHDVPLLTLVMDQGSIGCAGNGFTKYLGKMIFMKWDELHRLIRDIKLAFQHCCGGVFLKAQVFSSYIWGIHSRPFGSGAFHTILQRGLNVFLHNTPDRHSPRFQKYVHRIGAELGLPFSTEAEQDIIHGRLAELETFQTRPENSKLGRWFSWNGSAKQNLREFSAQKMVPYPCQK